MSLYGSGRAEGIGAVLLIGVLVLLARVLGAWFGDLPATWAAIAPAVLPAAGGMLCYRYLKAQGRSRYAAFLGGAAYGLSPWLLATAAAPREQFAAALAPLALEVVCHVDRPTHRRTWLPWAWCGLAAPFAAGPTTTGVLVALLCTTLLLRTAWRGEHDGDGERPNARALLLALALGAVAAANVAWLDPLAPWLGPAATLQPGDVLWPHRPGTPGFDLAAVLRVPGPVLLSFAALGLLRRQRQVRQLPWLALAVLGGVPTLLVAVPALAAATPPWLVPAALPAAAWWLSLIALCVLGAAGLDDFLDLPLRRRTALPWMLAGAVATAPLVPTFGSQLPAREWPLTATFLTLALMLPAWRRLGILRFKNWMATVAVITLALPTLQVTAVVAHPPATPLAEIGGAAAPLVLFEVTPRADRPPPPPAWHYAGLVGALLVGAVWALSAWRRSTQASTTPSAAKPAIVRKASPSQRR